MKLLLTRIPRISPTLFTVPMGTGIASVAISHLGTAREIQIIGFTLFILNVGIFSTLTLAYLLRLLSVPNQLSKDLNHRNDALFFGAVPMALATIVNAAAIYSKGLFGHEASSLVLTLWVSDLILAAVAGAIVPYAMFTRHQNRFEHLSVFWLIPIVPAEVTAASGGLIIPLLPEVHRQALWIGSLLAFSLSVPLALGVLTLVFLKFATHGIPRANFAASAWIAIGPLGTGALALVELTHDVQANWFHALPVIGPAMDAIGLIGGIVLWGYGLWWWVVAVALSIKLLAQNSRFDMGWWAFTFPLGVFNLATYAIGIDFRIMSFKIFAYAQTGLLCFIWLTVALKTPGWLRANLKAEGQPIEARDHKTQSSVAA